MLIVGCFMALMLRIVYIGFSDYADVGLSQSRRTVTIGTTRGKIYDRNLKRLVDSDSELVAAVTPAIGSSRYLSAYLSSESLIEKIESGYPFAAVVNEEINNEFIRTFSVPVRYSGERLATHLIGYLDSTGSCGVTGLEKSYNSYLKSNGGSLSVSFEVDALGRVLAGMDKYINDDNFNSDAGLVLTLDYEIQKITEQELENSSIKSGCAIVMQPDSGEILALASVPDYDPYNVAEYLAAKNSPFVNKALKSYSVGSVFKPLIAAAAIENGIDPKEEYDCTGSITIGDTTFNCYNKKAHKKVNMEKALQNSCNTYFINLIMKADREYLLELCRLIGLEKSEKVAEGVYSDEGALPGSEELSQQGNLANLAFGQGSLSLTPLHMAKIYSALATGNSISPNLILGYADSKGIITREAAAAPQKILSEETVLKIRKMLFSVTEKGNAQGAKSDTVDLAGKTGTAQSGIYENSKEICRTWFCGFFPADNPRYVVVVMNEKGQGGNTDCAPVFRKICEGIEAEK